MLSNLLGMVSVKYKIVYMFIFIMIHTMIK